MPTLEVEIAGPGMRRSTTSVAYHSSLVTDCKSDCKQELGIKKQLNSTSCLVKEGLKELPRHLKDRTGAATKTVVGEMYYSPEFYVL